MSAWLRPKYFFIGLLLGFVTCSVAGYYISYKARLNHFQRFFPEISGQVEYYPAVEEMVVTAKHKAQNKILVLVGGSSIFRGTGQNSDDLWTDELQNLLGKQYKVVNFANDGQTTTSFGAIAFRVLAEQYPKIIFVVTGGLSPGDIDGYDNSFKYLYWDAYYKHLIHPTPEELRNISALRKDEFKTRQGEELHIVSYLNSWFYFKNLWNWVGYRYVFTVWNSSVSHTPFLAKRFYRDGHYDYQALMKKTDEVKNKELVMYADYIKKYISSVYDVKQNKMYEHITHGLKQAYDEAFNPKLRPQILCVTTGFSPAYTNAVSKSYQMADAKIPIQINRIVKSLGYNTLDIKGMDAEDYAGDPRHFLGRGGKKIAKQVAIVVKKIALQNKYL